MIVGALSTGDGLALIAAALAAVGMSWAAAWSTVRSMAIRADALRRLGEHAWTPKATVTKRTAR